MNTPSPSHQGALTITEVRTNKQIEDYIKLCKQHHQELAVDTDFSEEVCRNYLHGIQKDLDREDYNAYIAYSADKPAGYCLVTCSQFFYSRQRQAVLQYWYVSPEYRNTSISYRLMKVYIEWARLRGAIKLWTSVAHDIPTEDTKRIGKLFERLGFDETGSYHARTLNRKVAS